MTSVAARFIVGLASVRGFTRIVPRMKPWPAPHTCEHSKG